MEKIMIGMKMLQNNDMKSFVFALIQLADMPEAGEGPFVISPVVRDALKDFVPDPYIVGATVVRLVETGIIDINDGQCFSVEKQTGKIVFGTLADMEALIAQDKAEGWDADNTEFKSFKNFNLTNIVGHA